MNFLKKNKIVVGVVVVVLIVLGVWFFVLRKGGGTRSGSGFIDETQNIKQISAADIGLELSLRADKKAVILKATKLEGIQSLEYELSYDAQESVEGETSIVPKGAVGSPIEVKGESQIKREILLGTCSANVCRYDKVKSNIKIVVRVNYVNGEVGLAEATLPYGEDN